MARRVEARRRGLDPLQPPGRVVVEPERRRRQIVGDREHRLVALVRGGGEADRRVARQRDLARAPVPAGPVAGRRRGRGHCRGSMTISLPRVVRDRAQGLARARRPDQARPRRVRDRAAIRRDRRRRSNWPRSGRRPASQGSSSVTSRRPSTIPAIDERCGIGRVTLPPGRKITIWLWKKSRPR